MSRHSAIAPRPNFKERIVKSAITITTTSLTGITASETFTNGPYDGVSNYFADDPEMFSRKWVVVHESVHGREYIRWGGGCQSPHDRCLEVLLM